MGHSHPARSRPARAVAAAVAAGTLRLPSAASPGFIDLMRACLNAGGAELPATAHSAKLAAHIGRPHHLVVVLVDGMGMTALSDPRLAELRERLVARVDAVSPATTACAMTSFTTGLWPGQHGVPGWWAHLPEQRLDVTVLPFEERESRRPLQQLGVQPADLWPYPSQFAAVTRDALMLLPRAIWDSPFSRYFCGGLPRRGYRSRGHALRAIYRRVKRSTAPTFTYCYLPEYDTLCHQVGVGGSRARALLRAIGHDLLALQRALPADTRVVVTADHGLIDIAPNNRCVVTAGDPLLDCLHGMPSGEPRMPQFHVQPGRAEAVRGRCAELLGDALAVVDQAEAAALGVFGPVPLSPLAQRRFGDLIGIALQPVTLAFHRNPNAAAAKQIGRHGGMTPAEVRVPVLVLTPPNPRR